MNPQTVYVVDDDEAVRDGLAMLLESAGHTARLFEDAESFLASVGPTPCGCLILDRNLPRMSGPQLQHTLVQRQIQLPVIFLSAHGDVPVTVQAMKAGAEDFLTKPVNGAALLECVQKALKRDASLHEIAARQEVLRDTLARLSARERDVLNLALQGLPNKDIARRLGISHRTVEVHRARIFLKTGASTMLELSALVRAAGLPLWH